MLVVGLGIGVTIGYLAAPDSQATVVTGAERPAQVAANISDQIKTGYERSVQLIAADEAAGRIAKETAGKARGKLQELYRYRQTATGVDDKTKKDLQLKRQEIRDWARQNDVSTRYFIRLY